MIGQGYQDAASNRNSGIILHPSSMHHQPPQNMQGMRGHTYSYSPQIPAPSYRHPTNNLHHGNLNPSRDGPESASRYSRSFASNGDRLSRPHRRASQAALDDINGRMRLLSSDVSFNFSYFCSGSMLFNLYDESAFKFSHDKCRMLQ